MPTVTLTLEEYTSLKTPVDEWNKNKKIIHLSGTNGEVFYTESEGMDLLSKDNKKLKEQIKRLEQEKKKSHKTFSEQKQSLKLEISKLESKIRTLETRLEHQDNSIKTIVLNKIRKAIEEVE